MPAERVVVNVGPLQRSGRIQAIDVLRGVALLGIVVVNAKFFGLPLAEQMDGGIHEGTLLDRIANLIVVTAAEFKFVSLFSLLFGFGLAMQRQRRHAIGEGFGWFGVRRMALLGIFGFLHAIGIWYGDILFIYAGVGLLLIPLLQLGATIRLVVGTIAIGWSATAIAALGALILVATPEQPDPSTVDTSLRGLDAARAAWFDPQHPIWIAAETEAFRSGPYLDAVIFRSLTWSQTLFFALFCFGWQMLGMALIGTWMHDVGMFGREGTDLRRRLAAIAFPIGCLLSIGCGAVYWFGPKDAPLGIIAQGVQIVSAALMAVGGAGLLTIVVDAGRLPGAATLATVGRMSLTAYLLESVVFMGLMSHWGFGWFGQLSSAGLVGLSLVVYLLVAGFCILWSRRFRMGPVEWIWRSASYLGRTAADSR